MGVELEFVICTVEVTFVVHLLRCKSLDSLDAPLNFLETRTAALISKDHLSRVLYGCVQKPY